LVRKGTCLCPQEPLLHPNSHATSRSLRARSCVAASTKKASGPVELRLHGAADGAQGDYWPKVASGFNARQSKIHVTFEPWLPDKGALVLAAAGTLGDVMRLVTASEYSQVAAKGVLKDLGPLVSQDKYDLKQFYAAAVETLKFRSKQFGLPHIAHPGFCGIFANLDTLKQTGVPEPDENTWTLAQLQESAGRLSGARDGTRWGLWPPTGIQHITVAARAHGGETLSRDGKKALIADPASVQGVQYLADLILKDRAAAPPGTLQGPDWQNFLSGKVSMEWTNFGIINTLNKQAQGVQWKVFLSPKGPKSRGFFMGVDAASINGATKYPDASFELVKYILSKDVCLGWFDVGFAPGGRPDTWNDPKVTSDPAFKVFARAMDEAAPLNLPDNGLITDFNGAITKELSAVWSGQVSVKDGTEAARRAAQEVLDRSSG
jgi:ABC-type glycerol-3-phosphate transport system substrate-binding protein